MMEGPNIIHCDSDSEESEKGWSIVEDLMNDGRSTPEIISVLFAAMTEIIGCGLAEPRRAKVRLTVNDRLLAASDIFEDEGGGLQ